MTRVAKFIVLAIALFIAVPASTVFAAANEDSAKSAASKPAQDTKALEDRIARLEKLLAETRSELAAARAGQPADKTAENARLAELEKNVEVLAKEIEALRLGEAEAPEARKSYGGMGPGISKVYGAKRGLSIGGYGEFLYQNFARDREDGSRAGLTDKADFLRAVLYVGYKFGDRFVLNTELEVAHGVSASDKGGEVEMEFGYLDYLHSKSFNLRGGLMLIPMGLINEFHEPPTFLGARRPDVEDLIIPTTWRELGIGAYGDLGPLSYKLYLVNGLDASRYEAETIGEGSGEGSFASARNLAVTGRLDYTGTPGAVFGVSFFTGDSGQGRVLPSGRTFAGRTTFFDVHADWKWRGIEARGLYVRSTVGDASEINVLNGLEGDESVGSRQTGWYLQAGFDVFSLRPGSRASLTPFFRYERYDTQAEVPRGYSRNPEHDVKQLTLGLSFKPIDNVVVKLDWQQRKNEAKTGVNQWNLALGYLF